MYRRVVLFLCLGLALVWVGCRDEEHLPLSMGIGSNYRVSRLELLSIRGALTAGSYVWQLVGDNSRGVWETYSDSVVSEVREFQRAHADTGTYRYLCVYTEGVAVMRIPFEVSVEQEYTVYSPYVVDVLEYAPGPGPEVNRLLRLSPGNSQDEVLFRCKDAICGPKEGALSLGAFGGYIVLAFDHLILNRKGPDLMIYNNVRISGYDGDLVLANSDPGVVHVGYDRNGNGKPDADEWYEIRGSAHDSVGSQGDYSITYYRPLAEEPGGALDTMSAPRRFDRVEYIAWQDNQGGRGYIPHVQEDQFNSYWPAGDRYQVDSITLCGRRLPSNVREEVQVTPNGDGTFQTTVSLRRWAFAGGGYANNLPDSRELGIDIADAVDGEGCPVVLPGIEFVRIHTASPPVAVGGIGVQATKVAGAVDLYMLSRDARGGE